MRQPFFIPTSWGDASAVATLPSVEPTGPPVIFFSGLQNTRIRDAANRSVTEALVERGRPVFRLDYPGLGSAPGTRPSPRDMPDLVTKVCEWVADVCGSKTVTIGGTCGAAVMALYAMAASPRVGEVIAISCPFRTFDDQPGPRDKVRAGIAAIDSVGVRLMPALTRRQGTRGEESMWIDELISAVANTPAGVRVFFLYGANDSQYAEFLELQASGDVPREVMDRWDVEVYPADELYGYSKFVVRDWLASSIVDWVAPRGSSADA